MKKLHENVKSLLAAGCAIAVVTAAGYAAGQEKADAEAVLQSTDGRDAGTAVFFQSPHGVLLKADLKNLPAGELGFHIHANGSCSPDFKAAGGHFNPTGKKHGFMSEAGPHLGDMPNIHVPASGMLQVQQFLPDVTVDKGENRLLDDDGAALMIHAKPDDYTTDPAGDAGDRIACGVIKKK